MISPHTNVCSQVVTPAQNGEHRLGVRAGFLLFVAALIVLLPGIHVSFTDRDEGNYAQVCREMIQTGDWLVPRHCGEPWLDKPPLLYWLTTASFYLLGMGEWQARLVSVLASSANVLLTGMLGAWMFGRRVGLIAGLLLATCGMFAVVGRMLLMDPILLTCILAAIACHYRIATDGPSHWRAAAYWLLIGLGILAKGPTILPFAGGFALALTRLPGGWKRLGGWRWWVWMPLAGLVAAPWYVLMSHQARSVMKDQFLLFGIVSRVIGTPDGHWGPPGYHLGHSLVTLLPWTVFVPAAILAAVRHRGSDPQLRLMLVWLILPWVVVELMRSKLPHYVLPCYVPLMILVARQWDAALTAGQWPSATWAERWAPAAWAGVMMMVAVAALIVWLLTGGLDRGWMMLLIGLSIAVGFRNVRKLLQTGRIRKALTTGLVTSVVIYFLGAYWLVLEVEPLRFSQHVASAVNETARPGDEALLCGYEEPSTFYYIQPAARPVKVAEIPARIHEASKPAVVAITASNLEQLEEPLRAALLADPSRRRVDGFNYVKGKPVTLWVSRCENGKVGRTHE